MVAEVEKEARVERMRAVLFLLLLVAFGVQATPAQQDIRGWDSTQGSVNLTGEWQLTWLSPQRPTRSVVLPFTWNDTATQPWGSVGFGHIALETELLLPDIGIPLALYFDDFKSAARIWVNDHLVVQRGVPGDAQTERARLQSAIVPLPIGAERARIRIELSNHFHHEGGIDMPVRLGEMQALQLASQQHSGLYLLLCGAALMMALFMGLLDRSSARAFGGAPFAAMLLLAGLRAASSGELLDQYFGWPALWNYRVEYLSGHLFAPAYGYLLLRLFPQETWRPLVRLMLGVGVLGAVLTLLMPPSFFTLLRDPCALWLVLSELYFLGCTVLAIKRRRPGAWIILLGMLAMDAAVINDLAMYSLGVQTLNLIPLGVLLLLLTHGLVVGNRVVSALARNIELREDLQRLNTTLEGRVEERTQALAVARDQALHEAEQSLQRQAMLSHELRTPLVAIQGHLQLLDPLTLPRDVQQRIRTVQAAAMSLTEVLDGLMLLSKAETVRVPSMSPFAPRALVEECAAVFRPQAEAKGLRLEVSCSEAVPAFVEGAAPSLRQILFNLLGNAIKFTESGSVFLSLTLQARGLLLTVRDTGCGVAPELQSEIFKAFVRDARAGRPGIGLGLYIVARLAELLDGWVQCTSQTDVGTSVELWLPWGATEEPEEIFEDDCQALHGLRVLLVEDVEVNREVTSELLRRWGCQVSAVASGCGAVDACLGQLFDVVLMDVHLPDIDGLEACRRILKTSAGHKPQILALTANAADLDPALCRSAGLLGILAKPLRREELVALLTDSAAASASKAESVVDQDEAQLSLQRLAQLREWLGGEVFDRLLPRLHASLLEVRSGLLECAADGSTEARRRHLCHRLQGSAVNFGFSRLAACAASAAESGHLPGLLDELERHLSLLDAWSATDEVAIPS